MIVGAGSAGSPPRSSCATTASRDIVILERAPELGGTWHYNSYPGCACDVPSHLYSFSFAQRRDWTRLCSPQAEINDYLHDVARPLRRRPAGRAGHPEVTSCSWSDAAAEWTVAAADGREWQADAVILATGQLHQPAIPQLDGVERFAGPRVPLGRSGTTTTPWTASGWR